MKDVATELYRAVISVKANGEKLGKIDAKDSSLELEFGGETRQLLKVLADTFIQSEEHFASNLLHHALAETLKILPDILPSGEFESLEQRIIGTLGISSYLSLRPIFGYTQGLGIPNYGEITTKNSIVLGSWDCLEKTVNITDPFTGNELYSYSLDNKPSISIDGTTLQWAETNVKPIYLSPVNSGNLVNDIENADILRVGESGFFYREDEYVDALSFKPYSNYNRELIQDARFTDLFNVRGIENGEPLVEPKSKLYSSASQSEDGSWYVGAMRVVGYSSSEVIINPAEQ